MLQVTGASWLVLGLADLYYSRAGVNRNGGLSAGINLSLGAYFLFKASWRLSARMLLLLGRQQPGGCSAAAAGLTGADTVLDLLSETQLAQSQLPGSPAGLPARDRGQQECLRSEAHCCAKLHPRHGAQAVPINTLFFSCRHSE